MIGQALGKLVGPALNPAVFPFRVLFCLTTCSIWIGSAGAGALAHTGRLAVVIVVETPPVVWLSELKAPLATVKPFVCEKSTPGFAVNVLVELQNPPKLRPLPVACAVLPAAIAIFLSAKYPYQLPSVACAILILLVLTVTTGSP